MGEGLTVELIRGLGEDCRGKELQILMGVVMAPAMEIIMQAGMEMAMGKILYQTGRQKRIG